MSYSNRLLWMHNVFWSSLVKRSNFLRDNTLHKHRHTLLRTFRYLEDICSLHFLKSIFFFPQVSKNKFTITDNSSIAHQSLPLTCCADSLQVYCSSCSVHGNAPTTSVEQHQQRLVNSCKLQKHFLVELLQRSSHLTAGLPLKKGRTTFFCGRTFIWREIITFAFTWHKVYTVHFPW